MGLKQNPEVGCWVSGVADIRQLLELEGYILDRITGSHHIFKRDEAIFVVPVHNKQVKSIYVRRVVELIEGDQE